MCSTQREEQLAPGVVLHGQRMAWPEEECVPSARSTLFVQPLGSAACIACIHPKPERSIVGGRLAPGLGA